jgi:hypothetical protein
VAAENAEESVPRTAFFVGAHGDGFPRAGQTSRFCRVWGLEAWTIQDDSGRPTRVTRDSSMDGSTTMRELAVWSTLCRQCGSRSSDFATKR